jgi:hypothetical protein
MTVLNPVFSRSRLHWLPCRNEPSRLLSLKTSMSATSSSNNQQAVRSPPCWVQMANTATVVYPGRKDTEKYSGSRRPCPLSNRRLLFGLCSSVTFSWKAPAQMTSNPAPWNERLRGQSSCVYTRRILYAGLCLRRILRAVDRTLPCGSEPFSADCLDLGRWMPISCWSYTISSSPSLFNAEECTRSIFFSTVLGHAGIPFVHASRKTTCPSRLKAGRSMPL